MPVVGPLRAPAVGPTAGLTPPWTPEGVRVAEVARDSSLFGYLAPNDTVRGVARTATPDLPSLQAALKGAGLSEGVVFDVERDGRPIYISVQAGR